MPMNYLLAPSAYFSFNKKLATLCGIEKAVYMGMLLDIANKALKKNVYDPETGMITLDRTYIQEETTLTIAKQRQFDQELNEGLFINLDPNNLDRMSINSNAIYALIVGEDVATLKEIVKMMKTFKAPKPKEDKSTFIIQMLKNSVVETDLDVRESYWRWIDSTYGKLNKKAQVETMQNRLNEYTKDKKVKKEILDICASRQYVDCSYAFDIYNKSHGINQNSAVRLGEQKVATKLKEGIEF